MKKNLQEKAVIYTRVSSREQEQEGYSIPAQLKLLNDYAQKNNIDVIEEFIDNETAKKAGRTNFVRMIDFFKKNQNVKTILVEKTDRLYRNFKDYVLLENYKLDIHLVKEGTILSENSRSNDKFIHGIKVLMAKNYIDNLSEEVKKGQRQKAEQGEYPGKPPYGYYRLNHKIIHVQDDEAKFVKRAFELYSEKELSLTRLIEELYKEGFIYKHNKVKIGKSNLDIMLKNVFYIGQFKFKDKIYDGVHEPIINRALFYKTQESFKKDNKPEKSNKRNFAFVGMFKCSKCGSAITAEIKKEKYIYYHCTGWHKKCSIKNKMIKEEIISLQLEKAMKYITIKKEHSNWLKREIKDFFSKEQEYHRDELLRLSKKIDLLKNRIDKMYIDYLDGIISKEIYLSKSKEWNEEIENNRLIIQAHDKANNNFLQRGIEIIELAENLYTKYKLLNNFEKAKLARIVLSNFYSDGENISYTYKKPFDILAEGLSFNKTLG
ncbi:MAG: recombinase family protein [Candidatus Gastranaerophilales bacterium]|nr:recombinase family protein [Candidatus Gastranaerophilales bacterium]